MSTQRNGVPDILIVDDSESDADLTVLAMQRSHPAPKTFWIQDADEALQYLLCERQYKGRAPGLPKLVVTDLQMPNMTGHQFLRRVRTQPSLRGLPMVVVSASALEADVEKSYRCGATGYLSKMADFDVFTAQMTTLVSYWLSTNKLPSDWTSRPTRRRRS